MSHFIEIGEEFENEITEFLQDRIENGPWEPHDMPRRMLRYGLQSPDAFIAEMRERIKDSKEEEDEDDEDEDPYNREANAPSTDRDTNRWAIVGIDPNNMMLEIIASASSELIDDHLMEIRRCGCVPLLTGLDIAKTHWGRRVTLSQLLPG